MKKVVTFESSNGINVGKQTILHCGLNTISKDSSVVTDKPKFRSEKERRVEKIEKVKRQFGLTHGKGKRKGKKK